MPVQLAHRAALEYKAIKELQVTPGLRDQPAIRGRRASPGQPEVQAYLDPWGHRVALEYKVILELLETPDQREVSGSPVHLVVPLGPLGPLVLTARPGALETLGQRGSAQPARRAQPDPPPAPQEQPGPLVSRAVLAPLAPSDPRVSLGQPEARAWASKALRDKRARADHPEAPAGKALQAPPAVPAQLGPLAQLE
jgi:hypothetical protein